MVKRGQVFIFLIVIFLAVSIFYVLSFNVFAQESSDDSDVVDVGVCDVSQMILKLSDKTNAHGGLVDSSLKIVEGKKYNSYEFDGINDYIEVLSTKKLDGKKFTISAWIKTNGKEAIQGIVEFSGKESVEGSVANGFVRRGIMLNNENGDGKLMISYGDGKYRKAVNSNIVDNGWHNVMGIYDGSEAKIYLDGELINLGEEINSFGGIRPLSLRIGETVASLDRPFDGKIDDVLIFSRVINEEEIHAIYAEPVLRESDNEFNIKEGLVSYYRFDENANDEISGNNGVLMESSDKVSICYNNIFNQRYLGENPHECNEENTNTVLVLDSEKNSHGKINEIANSENEIRVCYGDLSCTAVVGECRENEKKIVSLSSQKNAHFSISNEEGYEINICCSTSPQIVVKEEPVPTFLSIKISSPSEREKILTGKEINFEVEIENASRVGDVDLVWDFGDGKTEVLNSCLSKGNCNVKHVYSKQGYFNVVAKAKRHITNETSLDHVSVLTYANGINLFAIIGYPEFGEELPTKTPVDFNANESFVAECSSNCLGTSKRKECYEVGTGETKLSCYDFESPKRVEIEQTLGDYFLWFNWTFDKGKNNPDEKNVLSNWNTNYSDVVEFSRTFFAEGNHSASLVIGYEEIK